MPTLVIIRHGQSAWNAENRFTGWIDVDLSRLGEREAISAGRLLAAEAGLTTMSASRHFSLDRYGQRISLCMLPV